MNWLIVVLVVSSIFNILLIWYSIKVLQKLTYMHDNADALQIINKSFLEHIQGIHEMEMYYGDETLGGLIEHSKYVVEQYKNFNEIFEDLQLGIIKVIEEETQEETEEDAAKEIG